jgi:hypothetical protein
MAKMDVTVVQAHMNDVVTGDRAVSSRELFEALKDKLGLDDEKYTSFQVELSTLIKSGKVVGFVGTRGRAGGYFPVGKAPEKKEKAPTAPAKVVTLGGGLTMKLKKSGVTLKQDGGTAMHYTSMKDALGKASELLLAAGLTDAEGDVQSLMDAVASAEEGLLAGLSEVVVLPEPAAADTDAEPTAE